MKYAFVLLLGALLLSSCGNNNDFPKAENALVAAQQFLDACMKGDFKQATYYMQPDSLNKVQLKSLEDAYYHNSSDQRVGYRSANIIIENDEVVSPTEEVITYKNSYDKINRKLKAVQTIKEVWKVDLKYTFSGNL